MNINSKTRLAVAVSLAVAAGLLAPLAASAQSARQATTAPLPARSESSIGADLATSDSRFESALADYEFGRWQESWAAFASLADLGLPEAARIATLMWKNGPVLYRTGFSASNEQVQRWSSLASAALR